MTVSIDFETSSDADLKAVGAYVYSQHPSTKILCMAYAIDDREPAIWYPGLPFPAGLMLHVGMSRFNAFNSFFEYCIWNHVGVVQHGFPPLGLDQWDNTQATAMHRNLPAGLDGVAAALGLPERKDAEGTRLMRRMMKGGYASDADMHRLGLYCMQDVAVERAAGVRLGNLPPDEDALYQLDQRINLRGVPVDVEFARLAARAAADYQATKAAEAQAEFGMNPTQIGLILLRLNIMGVPLDDLRGDTLDGILDTPMARFFPADALALLTLRREAAAAAPKKYAAMLRAVSADGRIRGMFQYCGAQQTGRWSGRVVQLHNLMRPTMPHGRIMEAMDTLRASGGQWGSLAPFGPILEVLGNMLRPTIHAPGGMTKSDFAQIEARVLAWLACENKVLGAFIRGEDIYKLGAVGIFDVPLAEVTKDQRQISKVAELACGYGGGRGAFITMGRNYGVNVTEARAEEIKTAWRDSHPGTVNLWAECDSAAKSAIYKPGTMHEAAGGRLLFECRGGTLWCRLPSGRALAWHGARIVMRTPPWDLDKPLVEQGKRPVIAFQRPMGSGMMMDYTRGAVIVENVCQAVSRDVLAAAMLRAQHLPLFGHVHDEIWAEGNHVTELHDLMLVVPEWADGMPLNAETDWSERYRK